MKLLSIDVGIKNLAFCLLNIIPPSSEPDTVTGTGTGTVAASIVLWDVIDICHSEAEEHAAAQRAADHPKCSHSLAKLLKSKTATASASSASSASCSANAALYYYDNESVVKFICKRHANKMRECATSIIKYILPTPETLHPKKLLTRTSAEKLLDFCKRHDACDADWAKLSKSKVREKKTVLQERVRHILKTRYIHAYETLGDLLDGCPCPQQPGSLPLPSLTMPTTLTMPTPEHVSLITVGSNIMSKFDKLFYNHGSLDTGSQSPDRVIIENQISPIATRMKTVQGMVTQYFLMRGVAPDRISYISAANKLKPWTSIPPTHGEEECESEIDTYDDRKKLGIASTRKLLQSGETGCVGFRIIGEQGDDGRSCGDWLAAFETHKKKDDMADSLLQGLSYATTHHC